MRCAIHEAGCALLLGCLSLCLAGCTDDDSGTSLKNDCLKWSTGPNMAGYDIEFVYAIALPRNMGKILSAQVEAGIAGAAGTWMEHRSYFTDPNGQVDTPVTVGAPSVTGGATTTVDFVADTCAATLRYYYRVPEEAKGRSVSFTFSATASNGERVSYPMGPYAVSAMDMALDLALTAANCYISIEDMAVYNAAAAASVAGKIDLVYLHRNYNASDVTFLHALVSPAGSQYLPGVTLPAGVDRNTKIRKGGPKDAHLARLHLKTPPEPQPAVYVDDIDMQTIDLSDMPNYALNFIRDEGAWVETQDGKYRAYIYFNTTRSGLAGATVSIKRYTVR
ncbi:MAG: DUF4466 family protein [Tannerella sp.]|jgi:hypothetical protein|nr:DUF4466 family protein [Tannerella sp.]